MREDKLKRSWLLAIIFIWGLSISGIAQVTYETKNVDGSWADAANWINAPDNPVPYTISNGNNDTYTIKGKITVNNSLTIEKGTLTVNDTLIIKGNLSLGNNADMQINEDAVVIVYGDVTIENKVEIATDSYFVIMGDFNKTGSQNQGSFSSTDSPSNVYIGGTVNVPGDWSSDTDGVFNCDGVQDHDDSGCNYGNGDDLTDDPIVDVIGDNCTEPIAIETIEAVGNPYSQGGTIEILLTASTPAGSNITDYTWKGPGGFTQSSVASGDVTRSSATSSMSGWYVVTVRNDAYCVQQDSVQVEVNSCISPSLNNPGDQSACDTYTLPAITGTNLSGNEAYYTATNGGGTKYAAGNVVTSSTTLYIYDANGTCSSETSIEITVTKSPTTGSIFVPDSSIF
ncbi:MAG: hypothetical protein ACQESW_07855 [Bacteroidota bacterium]